MKIILHFVFLTQVIDDLSGQAAKSVKKDTRREFSGEIPLFGKF